MISRKRATAYIFLLINTITWGAALVVVKPALEFITPFNFLFSRFLLASTLSLPILFYYLKKLRITAKLLRNIVLLELVGTTTTLALMYLGVARTSAIEASLITTTAPLFLILLGVAVLKEKQEKSEWVGTAISFGGMILITVLPILSNGFVSYGASFVGNLLVVAANLTESSYFIAAKKQYKNLPKLFVASLSFIVGSISFGLLSLWENHWGWESTVQQLTTSWQQPSAQFAVFYMAVLGSIIGLTAYIKGQDSIEASEAGIFRYLQPAVYLPLGVILLGERISSLQWLGLGLILAGFALAEMKRKSR